MDVSYSPFNKFFVWKKYVTIKKFNFYWEISNNIEKDFFDKN